MEQHQRFRRYARETQAAADAARTERDREAWLRIAESWLKLIRESRPISNAEQRFDEDAKSLGTGQKSSDTMQ
jgi:hypothetical protein